MRPNQDQRLTSMGLGNATCDKCIVELYPDADTSICDDCDLNALEKGDATQFVLDALAKEATFPLDELLRRHKIMSRK